MKPLFIPLKAKFFEAFSNGEKDTEYRLEGPRWNARTCPIGRPVTLARGYGHPRLSGHIIGFHYDLLPAVNIPGWRECYGADGGAAICIKIKLADKS